MSGANQVSTLGKYVLASVTVILMVTASFITQKLQTQYSYSQPVFIVYFGTSMLLLCIPGQVSYYHCWLQRKRGEDALAYKGTDNASWVFKWSYLLYVSEVTQMPLKKLAILSIPFTSMWLAANFLLVSSFQFSDVASLLAAEQAAATFFVYTLSVFLLKESLTMGKVGGVFTCISGVVVIAVSDALASEEDGSSLGVFLAIGAAFASALYMVSTKKFLGAMRGIPAVTALLATIGLANAIFMWPIVVISDNVGWERFNFPSGIPCLLLFLSALFAFLFNYCVAWGIAISSPLFMRVATITTIPISFIVEIVFLGGEFKYLKVIGGFLVVVGFVAFSVFSEISARKAARARSSSTASASAEDSLVAGDVSAVSHGSVEIVASGRAGASSGSASPPANDLPVIPEKKREDSPLLHSKEASPFL